MCMCVCMCFCMCVHPLAQGALTELLRDVLMTKARFNIIRYTAGGVPRAFAPQLVEPSPEVQKQTRTSTEIDVEVGGCVSIAVNAMQVLHECEEFVSTLPACDKCSLIDGLKAAFEMDGVDALHVISNGRQFTHNKQSQEAILRVTAAKQTDSVRHTGIPARTWSFSTCLSVHACVSGGGSPQWASHTDPHDSCRQRLIRQSLAPAPRPSVCGELHQQQPR